MKKLLFWLLASLFLGCSAQEDVAVYETSHVQLYGPDASKLGLSGKLIKNEHKFTVDLDEKSVVVSSATYKDTMKIVSVLYNDYSELIDIRYDILFKLNDKEGRLCYLFITSKYLLCVDEDLVTSIVYIRKGRTFDGL